MRLSDSLAQFLGADVAVSMALAETLLATRTTTQIATETVEVEDNILPRLLIRLAAAENIEITAEEAIGMLFRPELLERFEVTAAHIAPSGSFTTWVMNARNAAVSEYTSYEFNSFARLGNRYVAASATGLYELLGDTDDGADIIGRIMGGFMQFGGTKLSRLSAAYIAARGEGDFVLRIETADGAVYNYQVGTRDMRSTKFHMGKGQRARYFAYELISAGQDFDLDTLEFVPVVVQRRV